MKKNIEMVAADRQVLRWAADILRRDSPGPRGSSDLILGLGDLASGSCSSLMLELDDGENGHMQPEGSRRIVCGDLVIDPAVRRVLRDQVEISLTPKEYDILYLLAKNKGQVFTKEQIYQAVWDDVYLMDDSNIMSFIRKIRKKIEKNPDAPQYIQTIWGIGYKFNDAL